MAIRLANRKEIYSDIVLRLNGKCYRRQKMQCKHGENERDSRWLPMSVFAFSCWEYSETRASVLNSWQIVNATLDTLFALVKASQTEKLPFSTRISHTVHSRKNTRCTSCKIFKWIFSNFSACASFAAVCQIVVDQILHITNCLVFSVLDQIYWVSVFSSVIWVT